MIPLTRIFFSTVIATSDRSILTLDAGGQGIPVEDLRMARRCTYYPQKDSITLCQVLMPSIKVSGNKLDHETSAQGSSLLSWVNFLPAKQLETAQFRGRDSRDIFFYQATYFRTKLLRRKAYVRRYLPCTCWQHFPSFKKFIFCVLLTENKWRWTN